MYVFRSTPRCYNYAVIVYFNFNICCGNTKHLFFVSCALADAWHVWMVSSEYSIAIKIEMRTHHFAVHANNLFIRLRLRASTVHWLMRVPAHTNTNSWALDCAACMRPITSCSIEMHCHRRVWRAQRWNLQIDKNSLFFGPRSDQESIAWSSR